MAPTSEETQRRFDTYERIATPVLLVNGFVYLGSFVALLTDRDPVAVVLFQASWVVFVIDYVVMVLLAPNRVRWIASHLLYLVALVFPPLRILLLFLLAYRALSRHNSPLRDRVGFVAVYVTTMIVVFGAYFVWQFERGNPGANIRTYGESLWWAIVTITTVGYGDYVPVTVGGRIVATVVLLNGIAAIAVLTGIVVSFFSDARAKAASNPEHSAPPAREPIGAASRDLSDHEPRLASESPKTEGPED